MTTKKRGLAPRGGVGSVDDAGSAASADGIDRVRATITRNDLEMVDLAATAPSKSETMSLQTQSGSICRLSAAVVLDRHTSIHFSSIGVLAV